MIKAMKQALRVLENTRECDAVNEAITSLRQAIADAEKQKWKLAAEQHGWEGLCSAIEAKLKELNT